MSDEELEESLPTADEVERAYTLICDRPHHGRIFDPTSRLKNRGLDARCIEILRQQGRVKRESSDSPPTYVITDEVLFKQLQSESSELPALTPSQRQKGRPPKTSSREWGTVVNLSAKSRQKPPPLNECTD